MLAIKELREDIRLGLSIFQDYVRPGGSLNLTDINVHAEDFVADILNLLYSWNLINTNNTVSNYPCIDLLETTQRIGIQVTSEKGAGKINQTIDCLDSNDVSKFIDHLKVFSLIPKQKSYRIQSCAHITFNWKNDVLDFDWLIRQINQVTDLEKLRGIHKGVTSAMPRFFASRHDTLRELRTRLEAALTVFSREVMEAPFEFEDPLLMYKAIREMRISLQKNACLQIPHEIAAHHFKAAKQILTTIEYKVRRQFPDIHKAAGTDATDINYKNGDFGRAITLMMTIRADLIPLLDELQNELQKIDMQM